LRGESKTVLSASFSLAISTLTFTQTKSIGSHIVVGQLNGQTFTHINRVSIYLPKMSNPCWGPRHMRLAYLT